MNLSTAITDLRTMRKTWDSNLRQLDSVIRTVEQITGRTSHSTRSTTTSHNPTTKNPTRITPAGRRAIALAQKKRWAKLHKTGPVPIRKAA